LGAPNLPARSHLPDVGVRTKPYTDPMAQDESRFGAPRGTRDLLPPESQSWQKVIRFAQDSFSRAGYQPIETPTFEHTEVFARGVGATSEVVTKQMYSFEDQGGRSLTLRPEATASVVRAVVEHNLHRAALPVKLAYYGWMYRQERPQKGRYRQFFQVGIEALGADSPMVDAEVIEVASRFYGGLGLDTALKLNSIGHPGESCRGRYNQALVDFLRGHEHQLAEEDRARIETNPMRTFDSKEPATISVMEEAPVISDYLCTDCAAHFEGVRSALDSVGIAYEMEPRLVRGLDYYTRTAFEFVSGNLGAQNAVGGGGRYDGLAEVLGGPSIPGIGFALGLDRIMLALADVSVEPTVTAYVVALTEEAINEVFPLVTRLRRAGLGCEFDLMGRQMKGQMKDASRSGARFAVIIGADELAAREATVKDLASGEQERVALDRLEEWLGA
jgi:histidyl-tRNA synthetase